MAGISVSAALTTTMHLRVLVLLLVIELYPPSGYELANPAEALMQSSLDSSFKSPLLFCCVQSLLNPRGQQTLIFSWMCYEGRFVQQFTCWLAIETSITVAVGKQYNFCKRLAIIDCCSSTSIIIVDLLSEERKVVLSPTKVSILVIAIVSTSWQGRLMLNSPWVVPINLSVIVVRLGMLKSLVAGKVRAVRSLGTVLL